MLKSATPQGSIDQGQEGTKSTVKGNQARMFCFIDLFELFYFILLGFVGWLIGVLLLLLWGWLGFFGFFVL